MFDNDSSKKLGTTILIVYKDMINRESPYSVHLHTNLRSTLITTPNPKISDYFGTRSEVLGTVLAMNSIGIYSE